jgi:hypothetical protein
LRHGDDVPRGRRALALAAPCLKVVRSMPRPRTPVELLQLNGGFRADRHGRRQAAPKSTLPIGEPPAHLADDEAAAWREHVRDAAPGVLTSGDRWALEAFARLLAKSRRQGLTSAELGHLRRFLTELGATPARGGHMRRTLAFGLAAVALTGCTTVWRRPSSKRRKPAEDQRALGQPREADQ